MHEVDNVGGVGLVKTKPRFIVPTASALSILSLLSLFLLSACAGAPWQGFPETVNPDAVWPGPPEPARVAFVMEIRQAGDLFEEGGAWARLRDWVAGPRDSTMSRPYALALHPEGGLLVTDPGSAARIIIAGRGANIPARRG
jgi:hypothetical protein